MVEIIFLGTGGGRLNLIRQVRATGGFIIRGGEGSGVQIHVDPGPGALVRAYQYKCDPTKTDVIIVTHAHLDHCADVEVLLEAMSVPKQRAHGLLLGSRNAIAGSSRRAIPEGDSIHGNGRFEPIISEYFRKKAERVEALGWGESRKLPGNAKIHGVKALHEEDSCFGFVLELDGKRIGYTSDTQYLREHETDYKGVDCLILNCLKPEGEAIPGHMDTGMAEKIIGGAKPKLAVLSHLGLRMSRGRAAQDANQLAERTGVKVIAAYDGLKLDI